jgi:hypothetical protein
MKLFVPLEGLVDLSAERTRLDKEIKRVDGELVKSTNSSPAKPSCRTRRRPSSSRSASAWSTGPRNATRSPRNGRDWVDDAALAIRDGRDNNFNLVRFAAAFAVLWSHSYAIVLSPAFEPWVQWLGYTPGGVAVDVFFITSGLFGHREPAALWTTSRPSCARVRCASSLPCSSCRCCSRW